jgi:hypothetical protein
MKLQTKARAGCGESQPGRRATYRRVGLPEGPQELVAFPLREALGQLLGEGVGRMRPIAIGVKLAQGRVLREVTRVAPWSHCIWAAAGPLACHSSNTPSPTTTMSFLAKPNAGATGRWLRACLRCCRRTPHRCAANFCCGSTRAQSRHPIPNRWNGVKCRNRCRATGTGTT